MCKYVAVVPVRAGSRRLKNKNISKFGESNLLEHKINILKRVPFIDKIIVSSDSNLMLDMACNLHVDTHKRPAEYCDALTKPFGSVVSHICKNIEGENVIWSPVTAPLISVNTYNNSIEVYEKNVLNSDFDSLISVESFKRYLWRKQGPVNYKLGMAHVPSQDLEEMFFITDGVIVAPREKMIDWSYFHGENPFMMKINREEAVDIDDQYDLNLANMLFEKYKKYMY